MKELTTVRRIDIVNSGLSRSFSVPPLVCYILNYIRRATHTEHETKLLSMIPLADSYSVRFWWEIVRVLTYMTRNGMSYRRKHGGSGLVLGLAIRSGRRVVG